MPIRKAVLTLALCTLATAAAAQTTPDGRNAPGPATPYTTPAAPATSGNAPVGHRQPTASSVPPAVRQDERAPGNKVDPLGPVPSICKNC